MRPSLRFLALVVVGWAGLRFARFLSLSKPTIRSRESCIQTDKDRSAYFSFNISFNRGIPDRIQACPYGRRSVQSTNRKPRITEIKAFAEPAGKPSDEVSSPPLPELIRPASSFKSQVSMEQLDRRPKWLSIGPPAIVVLGLFGALAYFAGLLIAIAALVSLAAFLTICINAAIKYTIDL